VVINNYICHLTERGQKSIIDKVEKSEIDVGFFSSRNIFSENNFYFCRAKCEIFFPEFNIRLYDKNSESDYFFSPPPKSEYFFQQHWESEYFLKKRGEI
jgi:hypothetical protein